jgi:2-oxoglutarate dehydrogenase E2 component (dihydrolipoamide succinyltransferase)
MLSKRFILLARSRGTHYALNNLFRAKFHSSRLLLGEPHSSYFHGNFVPKFYILAETVQVPQMAESISEGTLKSWSKKVGESVEADEEVATIETDKVKALTLSSSTTHLHLVDRCDRECSKSR